MTTQQSAAAAAVIRSVERLGVTFNMDSDDRADLAVSVYEVIHEHVKDYVDDIV